MLSDPSKQKGLNGQSSHDWPGVLEFMLPKWLSGK